MSWLFGGSKEDDVPSDFDKTHPYHTVEYWVAFIKSKKLKKEYLNYMTKEQYDMVLKISPFQIETWLKGQIGNKSHSMDLIQGMWYNPDAGVIVWFDEVANWGGADECYHPIISILDGRKIKDFIAVTSGEGRVKRFMLASSIEQQQAGNVFRNGKWVDPDAIEIEDEVVVEPDSGIGQIVAVDDNNIGALFTGVIDRLHQNISFDVVSDVIQQFTGVDIRLYVPTTLPQLEQLILPALSTLMGPQSYATFYASYLIGKNIEERMGVLTTGFQYVIDLFESENINTVDGFSTYNNIMVRRKNYRSKSKRPMKKQYKKRTNYKKRVRKMGVTKTMLPTKYKGLKRGSKVKPLKIDLWPSLVSPTTLAQENRKVISFKTIDPSTGQPSDLKHEVQVVDILRGRVNDPNTLHYLVYEHHDFQTLKQFVEDNVKHAAADKYECKVTGVKFVIRSPLPEPCFVISKINDKLNTNISDKLYKNKIYLRNKEVTDFAQVVVLAGSYNAKANIKIYYRIRRKIEEVKRNYYPTLNDVFFSAVNSQPITSVGGRAITEDEAKPKSGAQKS